MIKTASLALVASAALLSGSQVDAMESFLAKIPNGSLFGKWLGHTDTAYTQFGNDFSSAFEWNERLCKLPFSGASMTYGEAFGDPCCTWKVGATPQTIMAWAKGGLPTKKTVCASGGSGGSSGSTPTVTSAAPTPASNNNNNNNAPSPASPPASSNSKPKKSCKKKLL